MSSRSRASKVSKSVTPHYLQRGPPTPLDDHQKALNINEKDRIPKVFGRSGDWQAMTLGVSQTSLHRLAWFHSVVKLSWISLLCMCGVLYLCIQTGFAGMYYWLSDWCELHQPWIVAMYFSAVTFPANGGYLGEDPQMVNSSSNCYRFRTYLVILESFSGTLVAAFLAALFVTKASTPSALRHKIVFSSFATLTTFNYWEDVLEEPPVGSYPRGDAEMTPIAVQAKPTQPLILSTPGPSSPPARIFRSTNKFGNTTGGARAPTTLEEGSGDGGSPSPQPQYYLSFRVGNLSNETLVDGYLRVHLITHRRVGSMGLRLCIEELTWETVEEKSQSADEVLLWFPCTVIHRINDESPLKAFLPRRYGGDRPDVSSDTLGNGGSADFEIVAVFKATDAATAAVIEAKHSYKSHELISGYHLSPILTSHYESESLRESGGAVAVDFYRFNEFVSDY